MPHAKKTWQQKLADAQAKPGLPKVFFCPEARQRILVPSPTEVEQIIRRVPRGKLITMAQISACLRAAHDVDIACPMTTGIFTWILAHAAAEAAAAGRRRVLPWWRVLKTGGTLNPKFPGAGRTQHSHLVAEGHRVRAKGKTLHVADYERALVKTGAPGATIQGRR